MEHIDELRSVDGTGRDDPLELEDTGDLDRGFPLPHRLHRSGVHFVGIVCRIEDNGSLWRSQFIIIINFSSTEIYRHLIVPLALQHIILCNTPSMHLPEFNYISDSVCMHWQQNHLLYLIQLAIHIRSVSSRIKVKLKLEAGGEWPVARSIITQLGWKVFDILWW